MFVLRSLKEPCNGCEAPYGYQNVMSLSTDTDRFAVSDKSDGAKEKKMSVLTFSPES